MINAGWVTFQDGPAAGKKFHVQRAPIFLRAVANLQNEWDVLDLLDDTPEDSEEIHVYKQDTWAQVCYRGSGPESGIYYTYLHVPIDSELKAKLRYTRSWREWTELQRVGAQG